ncbi:[4Fe-4S] dicluster domain-containing protein [Arcobacter venerupis]|uniref:[4Fe-4S] dicluster domain-containing protein n=1 Tax=Arcobacter venerupis TaxID=1054033 RepID=A0AAE7BAI2_9BACT|nr:4Fe-4S dicluster domain-containing protein [Arcobacter venerupis]QKF66695.1 [4Fe-4S] dicluster domain-containing protein [Arcobacter venerupis]RWS49574.1 4Fe-4S ferredoxin [Arcobacter venerupis]
MQEFIYYNASGLDFPISEQIFVTTNIEDTKNKNFLISNTSEISSEISAQEIDFYIKNSQDNLSNKIKNVLKLYEIAASKYDFALDIPYSAEISNEVLIIVNSQDEYDNFLSNIEAKDFELFSISADILKSISGNIGNLQVIVDDEGEEITLNVSQIVWFDAKQMQKERIGIFNSNLSNIQDVIKSLKQNINSYSYKKFTTYDPTICQYNERRVEICSKCEDVCPTVAITKNDKTKTLTFSQIDCFGCGGCISVCPSGSLDYAPTNRDSLFEMSKFYKDTHPLILPLKMNIQNLELELKDNVLPFAIEGEKFLDESSLLTLLQLSGSQVIFYCDFLSKGTADSIRILNDIYQKRFALDAVLVASNEEELALALEKVSFVEDSYFNFNQSGLKKREVFSQRLQKIVGNEDLGIVTTGEHIHYGTVKVNQDNCTLCLSCVGACNVDALFANESDFTLRVNPSLCTSCGYCEISCPEIDCLTIQRDEIQLQPMWFKENILAKDKLFACVECGKEFATTKAIEKIASIMAPIFAKSSETKKRTLYCCEDCKAKLMIKQGLLDA